MTVNLSPTPYQRFVDSNGNALSGGLLYTYAAGTTTPQATYTDSTGGTPNTNPIVLNTRGEASIWLDPTLSYKFVLQTSGGAGVWSQDYITAYVGTNYFQNAEVQIASAATTDIGSAASAFIQITGATTITSFGTNYKGPKYIRFAGALTLTNSASLILPGGANITTAAGDTCIVVPKATAGSADGWAVVSYQHAPPPAFSVYQSAGQTVPNVTNTKLQFQSKEFDTGGFFDNTTNYRFQPTVAGYYELQATGSLSGLLYVSIYKNGAEYKRGQQLTNNATGIAAGIATSASALVFLNGSTDYVEVWAFQASGSSQTTFTNPSTHFSGYLARFP